MFGAIVVDLTKTPTLIISGAAVLVAVGVLWRGLIKPVWSRVKAIHDLIEHELKPNGGQSMKDTTTRAADAVDEAVAAASAIADQIREIRTAQETTFHVFDAWTEKNQREHAEIWEALATLGYRRTPKES